MKDKLLKITGATALAFDIFLASGLSFFEMIVRCRGRRSSSGKKWFEFSHTRINHPRHKYEELYEEGKAWCSRQPMRDCYIQSIDHLTLHAYYLPAEQPRRSIILCHGYRGSGFGDFANIAKFLHENHCNLLFIDQRCCGKSEGEYITFGAMEQYDVQRWARFLCRHNQERLPVYLYGESMGAASVLMASGHKLPPEVKGIIADCGFRTMKGQIQDIAAGWFHLRWIDLLLLRLRFFCVAFGGFHMKDADTAKAMETNRRPVLFFHGADDTYVLPENSKENFELCRAPKELVIVPEARHLCSAYAAPELYRQKIMEFFDTYA